MKTASVEAPDTTLEALVLRVTKRCGSAVFSSALRRALPGHLTPQQLFVLAHLYHHPSQPSALAREHYVGMSAMTGLVDGLVARHLVERRQDPHDRRAVHLIITEEGRTLWEEAQAAVLESTRQFLAPLTGAERRRLTLALGDLDRVLDVASDAERSVMAEEHQPAERTTAGTGHWSE